MQDAFPWIMAALGYAVASALLRLALDKSFQRHRRDLNVTCCLALPLITFVIVAAMAALEGPDSLSLGFVLWLGPAFIVAPAAAASSLGVGAALLFLSSRQQQQR